jgi:flagellar basal-body rod modification protein FlgD
MRASFQGGQNLQAASMIGHGVVVPGSGLELKDGKSILGFELPQSAEKVEVLIKDGSGSVVRKLDPGFMTSGFNSMTWDGKTDAGASAINGNYSFEVRATSGGKKMDASTFSFGLVSSVSFGSQGTTLSILNMGDVPMSDVRQVF